MADELKIVHSSIKSCLGPDDDNDKTTLPHKYRRQGDIHKGSCIQHALATSLDILQYQKLKRNGLPLDKLNVDIGFLIRKHPPPRTASKILKDIIENHKGLVRAETMEYPFQLSGFKRYAINRGRGEAEDEGVNALKNFVGDFEITKAPGVGLFGFSMDNKPSNDVRDVFVSNETGIGKCPVCKRETRLRHAVCITGFGLARYPSGGDKVQIVQYLDSERPGQPYYMTAMSLKSIIVPQLSPAQATPEQQHCSY